ncbi:SDR family oxidoreductase [Methylobacterium oryzihabitans]|uniref:SDR family oxidoreductase n=1 Tax=Methylobacterium oryzihabitans TaxID=2499852 RepID=UPI001FE4B6C5|nr:SDR family oxidoreductase [Methylobacterium oryzihabitans]
MSTALPRILVVGGAGVFGSRLARGLAASGLCAVVVAGRDRARTEGAAGALARAAPGVPVEATVLDAATATPAMLRDLDLAGVIDAAGPYHAGEGAHRLARAAIGAGLPYCDLADGRAYVAGFSALDAAAREAGVSLVTGASTTPALSNAVLDHLTRGWRRVETIEAAISPGNRAPRGLAVMRSILSYAGRPVRVWRAGAWETRPGWGLTTREAIPGLGRRWLSLCETPDLDILPARFPDATAAVFRAGLELPGLHLGLWLASLPVRARLLPSLEPFARLFLRLAVVVEGLGSDRGGMMVRVSGLDGDGRPVTATWTLVAEAGDGPVVPTLAALALARRWLAGPPLAPGARACVGLVDLDALAAEMAPHRIRATIRRDAPGSPLFGRALGPGFAVLPEAVRAVHRPGTGLVLGGRAGVVRGRHPVSRLVGRLLGLPPASAEVPVRVTIAPEGEGEVWTRDFAGRRFRSRMGPAGEGAVEERFGPLALRFRLEPGRDGLGMTIAGWRLGRLPLPVALAPAARARESVDAAGRFRFDVAVDLPLVGPLVQYRGWLAASEESPPR